MPAVTPLSPLPTVGFTLTLPSNAVVVEADPAPFNNTKEVIVLNLDDTNAILVQFVDAGNPPALPAAGSVTQANSTVVPAGAAATFCLGPEGERNAVGTVAFWTADQGSNIILVFKTEGGTDIPVNVTYVQSAGGQSI